LIAALFLSKCGTSGFKRFDVGGCLWHILAI
jgi:hypothetical protein